MPKTKVHVIEVVKDAELRDKEARASRTIRRFFPNAGPVRLYRTADGRIGIQVDLSLTPGDRKRLDDAYGALMKVLGERRGRPRGAKKVQMKLLLPERAYRALKHAAAASNSTMSGLVERLADGLEKPSSR